MRIFLSLHQRISHQIHLFVLNRHRLLQYDLILGEIVLEETTRVLRDRFDVEESLPISLRRNSGWLRVQS